MKCSMAHDTSWDHIKPIGFIIPVLMMVVISLGTTITLTQFNGWQSSSLHGVAHDHTGFDFERLPSSAAFIPFPAVFLAFFRLVILSASMGLGCFALGTLSICFADSLALCGLCIFQACLAMGSPTLGGFSVCFGALVVTIFTGTFQATGLGVISIKLVNRSFNLARGAHLGDHVFRLQGHYIHIA